ncbi:MAG: signal recognition particle-docking protein FtsY [Nanoarchaeota archaeon]|nr:signal recognition particle-docking protein FtsY [Nanoarchaeota archaeon]
MFGKLKEKLKNWTHKFSEEVEKEEKPEFDKETLEEEKRRKEIQQGGDIDKILRGEAKFVEKIKIDLDRLEKLEDIDTKPEEQGEKPGDESFFKKITSKIQKVKISEKEFEIYSEELETLLLENNVALEVTEKIIKELKEKIIGKEFLKKEIEEEIKDSFKEIIREILINPFRIEEKIKEKISDQSKEPYVILFCGINGTGKTTTIAKIAESLLKEKGISCVIAAADTFRAASIEQLKIHGEKLGVKIISNEYGSDPASVGFDAINYAKKNLVNCVLIDTAGRMHTAKNLIKEIEKISRVCKPDLKIFVGESLTGNDMIEQAKSFNFSIGIDGIILTKADIDDKGGTALSVGYVTKKPILYLGTGQEYNKIEPFDKEKFIERLGL